MTKDETMRLALEALERSMEAGLTGIKVDEAITALRQALEQPERQPVAWLEPELGEKICPEIGYEMTITDDHPKDLCWIPLYPHPPHSTSETDEEIKAKCPRTDSIWSLGWVAGYKACNQNTAQSYLKGFDEGCKSMSAKNIGCLGMPVNVPVTPPKQPEQEPVAWELRKGKKDRVLIEITNNPKRAYDWKCSLEEAVPLYTAPPKREWVGLTDEEALTLVAYSHPLMSKLSVARAIEAKLKGKNNG